MEKKVTGWLIRNKDEIVCFYENKPEKGFDFWCSKEQPIFVGVNASMFDEVKWEDEEPTKVELTIKICK